MRIFRSFTGATVLCALDSTAMRTFDMAGLGVLLVGACMRPSPPRGVVEAKPSGDSATAPTPANATEPAPAICPGQGEVVRFEHAFTAIAHDDQSIYLLVYQDHGMAVWRIDSATHERNEIASLGLQVEDRILDVDATSLYFVTYDKTWNGPSGLWRMPKEGGEPIELAHTDVNILGLMVDGGDAFFTTDGVLRSVDVATGEGLAIASDGVTGFEVSPSTVYWARDKELHQTDRASGEQRRVQFPLSGWVGGLHHDRDFVLWWDDNDLLQRASKSGGPQQVVIDDDHDALAFEIIGNDVYWSDCGGELWRKPLGPAPGQRLAVHGNYDNGDYNPLLLVAHGKIYWQAGPDGNRAQDGEPLALYYYCL